MTIEIPRCSIHAGNGVERRIPDGPIECEHCSARIPGAVALGFEGADYLHHFCGAGCLRTWCEAAGVRDA